MKILSKLTLKNLSLNKTRTAVTIIGIMLSTALIMVVAGMMSSLQQTIIEQEINYSGNYEFALSDTNAEFINEIRPNRDVDEIYVQAELGCAKAPNPKNENRPYINITGLSKNCFESGFNIVLEDGRFPENDSEVILTKDALKNYDPNLKVGDKITLDVGTRVASNGEIISDTARCAKYSYADVDEEGNYIYSVTEEIQNAQKKTYTVTGIIEHCNSYNLVADSWTASSTAITLIDDFADCKNLNAYINIKPESEKDYLKATELITGLSKKTVEFLYDVNIVNIDDYEKEASSAWQEIENSDNFSWIETNSDMLKYKGYNISNSVLTFLYTAVGIVIIVIIVSSVFVIRNSFAISITEKTKLYGMLLSTGATPKQVKKNVLFEGFVLGVIAVSLGLLLGIGVIALLVWLLNILVGDYMFGLSVVYSMPWWLPFFTIAMSAIVIFGSTHSAAVRASKISPVVAIRENNDVKISKKHYKSPKFIKKLFGVGGDISYKYLKRNKKKYRTTVISIIVSVTVFITISTFVDYSMMFGSNYLEVGGYDFEIYTCTKEQADVITSLDGINDYIMSSVNHNIKVTGINGYSSEFKKYEKYYDEYYANDVDYYNSVVILEDDYFEKFAQAHGFDYNKVKDKALVYNSYFYVDENGNGKIGRYFDFPANGNLEITFLNDYFSSQTVETPKANIAVGGEILEIKEEYANSSWYSPATLILSESCYTKNVGTNKSTLRCQMLIDCEDTGIIRDALDAYGYYEVSFMDYQEVYEQNNTMMLVISIFAYGFIAVISLIGITNIFNTITTNMKLRRKEFATLRSVGMTDKEFNRMIRLESLFYGVKSLAIGIPLGIIGGLFIHKSYAESFEYTYRFPWLTVLISIVCVFAMLWLIMRFSIGKIKKQNIIETIRNDNI